eukprot:CAMPEP_0115637446 /NCGR_PEP_ID=MMETSP0272-20121206/34199_1 /TAXON_ID=71861 /ORGANISM="Scrippsiella trochoidea, Strain CCMP3099" /LENGTH=339 /DNA_ID=CAMNT_0003074503 /DNA_START=39 /DNA_END=1056 /DNA_ORIENTATION=-
MTTVMRAVSAAALPQVFVFTAVLPSVFAHFNPCLNQDNFTPGVASMEEGYTCRAYWDIHKKFFPLDFVPAIDTCFAKSESIMPAATLTAFSAIHCAMTTVMRAVSAAALPQVFVFTAVLPSVFAHFNPCLNQDNFTPGVASMEEGYTCRAYWDIHKKFFPLDFVPAIDTCFAKSESIMPAATLTGLFRQCCTDSKVLCSDLAFNPCADSQAYMPEQGSPSFYYNSKCVEMNAFVTPFESNAETCSASFLAAAPDATTRSALERVFAHVLAQSAGGSTTRAAVAGWLAQTCCQDGRSVCAADPVEEHVEEPVVNVTETPVVSHAAASSATKVVAFAGLGL